MRTSILAAVLALTIATPAVAQTPLTMDRVRSMAAAGLAPYHSDMELLRHCPNLVVISDMPLTELGELSTTARQMRIEPGALWYRRNDAAIAQCLANKQAQ